MKSKLLLPFIFFILFSVHSFATHIVGGDITVKWISGNTFEITLTFYRDCTPGNTGFDPTVQIGVFDKVTNFPTFNPQPILQVIDSTVVTLGDNCYNPNICMKKCRYVRQIVIPNNPNGYYISWQRCCRNSVITNIVNPGNAGYIFYAEMPDPALHNSSPTFSTVPDGYMCQRYPNIDSYTATDSDGDILIYSFSQPLDCATYGICSNTNCTGAIGCTIPPAWFKPYGVTMYQTGYSLANAMGDPAQSIDANGNIFTTPPNLGVYVICVTVGEYRNGVKIGEIRRDFQYKVLPCSTLTIASSAGNPCLGVPTILTAKGAPTGSKYIWSPGGQTTSSISVSPGTPGTYVYKVTATKGLCIATTQDTVRVKPLPQANVVASGSVCLGQNTTLTANVIPPGGTPPFTYSWLPGGMTTSAISGSNLNNGTYTVTITNKEGCTSKSTGIITQATAISATVSVNQIACSGDLATAAVSASNGFPGYQYLWTPTGQTAQTATGLNSGTYSVTITDTKGCSNTQSVSIAVPGALSVGISSSGNVSCNGGDNGTATASITGGTSAFTYNWVPSAQTTATATGLNAGTYSITVTDTKGCTNTASLLITQPSLLKNAISSSTDVNCNGGSDGKATTKASGGTLNYSYLWLPTGQTSISATGLNAGTYSVTVTDGLGCTNTTSVTIAEPLVLNSTTSYTLASCSNNNGAARANPSGGNTGYIYSWSPGGATTKTISNLTGGTYSVLVTDKKGCTVTKSVTVPSTNAPTASTSVTDATCLVNNGTGTAIPSGGTPNYTYLWTDGQTTSIATGLAPGTYSVTVKDQNGCSASTGINVAAAGGPTVTITPPKNDVSCYSGNNGSATATPVGGITPYTFLWSNGQTTSTATGLSVGTYSVVIRDKNSCSYQISAVISQPDAQLGTSTASSTNVSCNNGNDGIAIARVTGGTPNYSYLWNNLATTSSITGLTAGNYSVTITDNNGCTMSTSVTITEPTTLTASAAKTDVACFDDNSGSASINPLGGNSSYTFLWSNGQISSTATGLSIGAYSVLVTDNKGCTTTNSVIISQPNLLTISPSQIDVSCNGLSDASAIINASGGTPNYSYSWNNGQTTSTATGLSMGTYSVLVTDNKGCTTSQVIAIIEPKILTSVTTDSSAICNGTNTGFSTVTTSGGTPNYSYIWNNGHTSSTATGLSAGNYSVLITDAHGCTATNTVIIAEPLLLQTTLNQNSVRCYGDSTGSATINAKGGTPGYKYLWSDGQTTFAALGLVTKSYSVVITDSKGCSRTDSVKITQPDLLTSSFNKIDVKCYGNITGSATVIPSGGTPSYSYLWSNGKTTSVITGISAGVYSVLISDTNDCHTIDTIKITQPPQLSLAVDQKDVLCSGGNSGSADVNTSGGVTPYTYVWNNGSTTSSISGIKAGTYIISIVDQNGCSVVNSIIISEPSPLTIKSSQVNAICTGNSSGSANIVPSGGTSPYSYIWSNGQTSSTVTGLSLGSYSVIITDAHACSTSDTFKITQSPPISVSVLGKDSICLGLSTILRTSITNGTPAFTFLWYPGNQTTSSIMVSPSTSASYSVSVVDKNGCTAPMQTFVVNILPRPTAKFDTVAYGDKFSLSYLLKDLSTGSSQWHWIFNDGKTSNQQNPIHTFPGAGIYSINQVVFNSYGCPDTALLRLVIKSKIIIPNIFTPDDDGTNDEFYIPNNGMESFHITIFDRWGLKIFETTSSEIRWDGRSPAGKMMVDGTYFYVLEAVLKNPGNNENGTISYQGTVTLLTNRK